VVRHRVPCAVAGLGDGVVTKLGPIVLVVQAGPAPVRARCQRGRAHAHWNRSCQCAEAGSCRWHSLGGRQWPGRPGRRGRSFFVEAP
jgi:hypothetical protein